MKYARLALLPVLVLIGLALITIVAAQDGNTAKVEVRVWQDVNDAESIYISARPEGGSWGTLGTIPLPLDDGLSSSGRFRYGDIAVDVPLPAATAPPARVTPAPSDTRPVTHYDSAGVYGFIYGDDRGTPIWWIAREGNNGSIVTVVEIEDGSRLSSGYNIITYGASVNTVSKLHIACVGGKLSIRLYPGDYILLNNQGAHRTADLLRGDVVFQIDRHGQRKQTWINESGSGSLTPILRSRDAVGLFDEMLGSRKIYFWGGQHRSASGDFSRRVISFDLERFFGTPVQWNLENCGRY